MSPHNIGFGLAQLNAELTLQERGGVAATSSETESSEEEEEFAETVNF